MAITEHENVAQCFSAQGGGKGGRQNPKTKISTLTQQLKELEEELAAVEKDCAQLDEENKALLEQAQSREAEVERERAKIARAMPPPQQAPAAAAASPQGAPVRLSISLIPYLQACSVGSTN